MAYCNVQLVVYSICSRHVCVFVCGYGCVQLLWMLDWAHLVDRCRFAVAKDKARGRAGLPSSPSFLLALPNQSFVSGPMSIEKRHGDGAATPRRSCAPSSETVCHQRMSKRTGRLNGASVIQFNHSTLTKSRWEGNVGVSRHFPHIQVI